MNYTFTTERIDSFNELTERLQSHTSIIVGNDTEQRKEFYLVVISNCEEELLRIGMISEDQGLKPQYTIEGEIFIVGINHEICTIILKTLEIKTRKLNSLFYEFISTGYMDSIIIVCETEVYCCNYALDVVWELCCDLIVSFHYLCEGVYIETEDGSYFYSYFDGSEISMDSSH